MAWASKIFLPRDIWVLLLGVFLIQALAFLTINRFMFHPVKNGYTSDIMGFVDIGTNGVSIAARIAGAHKGKKVVMYCHGNAEDLTAIDGRFDALIADGYTVVTFDYPGYGLSDGTPDEEGCYRNAFRLYDWLVCCREIPPPRHNCSWLFHWYRGSHGGCSKQKSWRTLA